MFCDFIIAPFFYSKAIHIRPSHANAPSRRCFLQHEVPFGQNPLVKPESIGRERFAVVIFDGKNSYSESYINTQEGRRVKALFGRASAFFRLRVIWVVSGDNYFFLALR
ncbi:hypothetical protein CDAR_222261 [Caerostris darwini]|uniref:Uncharacterized protein n=1 Tax=Caerostris darwini TaxID=1538125 RepID=A0AAV4W632_9ARAC|nr:hypothetical protein CDAR_222261 [Caerostris darwini]